MYHGSNNHQRTWQKLNRTNADLYSFVEKDKNNPRQVDHTGIVDIVFNGGGRISSEKLQEITNWKQSLQPHIIPDSHRFNLPEALSTKERYLERKERKLHPKTRLPNQVLQQIGFTVTCILQKINTKDFGNVLELVFMSLLLKSPEIEVIKKASPLDDVMKRIDFIIKIKDISIWIALDLTIGNAQRKNTSLLRSGEIVSPVDHTRYPSNFFLPKNKLPDMIYLILALEKDWFVITEDFINALLNGEDPHTENLIDQATTLLTTLVTQEITRIKISNGRIPVYS